jgi:hypothetical protein
MTEPTFGQFLRGARLGFMWCREVRAPGIANLNTSLIRVFRVAEGKNLHGELLR